MLQLATLIEHHSRFRPDEIAVVFEGERLTWRAFFGRVDRCAKLLYALGVRKGDRVATLLPNCREMLEIYWAVPSMGAVLVPLSPLLMLDHPTIDGPVARPGALGPSGVTAGARAAD
jgi:long-chain acyl-CoA synthetase